MTATEHLDVLIVGAGVSGIGAARYLRHDLPDKSFAILEARGASGGTWDLFTYPGIRSDSDLHTFGYEFKPWTDEKNIADADSILRYLRETIRENHLEDAIRLHHRVVAADWSSEDQLWRVRVERGEDGEQVELTAGWLFCASGYYSYESGYTPDFPGRERFQGEVIHPQHWPADLDHTGKRVVVIGSGATAVTLIPAMAEETEHITMLQRTPSYVMPVPSVDALANRLRKVLGAERAYRLTRARYIRQQRLIWAFCQRFPKVARAAIRRVNQRMLPDDFDVDKHFNPPYDPWDQRLCAVPDGDLFKAIRKGRASVVTDTIETFTETGIDLASGEHLPADVIVTATGLRIQIFGAIDLSIDGEPLDVTGCVAYKGVMLSGVPNFSFAIGYTNSSWTLKVGLICEYLVRLWRHMDATGSTVVVAQPDPGMPTRPLLDFDAGYVRRALDTLPRQGDAPPWAAEMNYYADRANLREGDVVDEFLTFETPHATARTA